MSDRPLLVRHGRRVRHANSPAVMTARGRSRCGQAFATDRRLRYSAASSPSALPLARADRRRQAARTVRSGRPAVAVCFTLLLGSKCWPVNCRGELRASVPSVRCDRLLHWNATGQLSCSPRSSTLADLAAGSPPLELRLLGVLLAALRRLGLPATVPPLDAPITVDCGEDTACEWPRHRAFTRPCAIDACCLSGEAAASITDYWSEHVRRQRY